MVVISCWLECWEILLAARIWKKDPDARGQSHDGIHFPLLDTYRRRKKHGTEHERLREDLRILKIGDTSYCSRNQKRPGRKIQYSWTELLSKENIMREVEICYRLRVWNTQDGQDSPRPWD